MSVLKFRRSRKVTHRWSSKTSLSRVLRRARSPSPSWLRYEPASGAAVRRFRERTLEKIYFINLFINQTFVSATYSMTSGRLNLFEQNESKLIGYLWLALTMSLSCSRLLPRSLRCCIHNGVLQFMVLSSLIVSIRSGPQSWLESVDKHLHNRPLLGPGEPPG